MAYEEQDRTMARKRIYLIPDGQTPNPDSDPYVDVPVIVAISFIGDGSDLFQEIEYSIDNSSNSGRTVHADQVYQTDMSSSTTQTDDYGNNYQQGAVTDTTDYIKFERIDKWPIIADGSDLFQENEQALDNKTGNTLTPPHFGAHQKSHVFRYVNPDDPENVWIDAEVLDQFSIIADGSDLFQEVQYNLNNPDVQADIGWPEISDSTNGIDPPWRIDPFQNIINWNAYKTIVELNFAFIYGSLGGPPPGPSTTVQQVTWSAFATVIGIPALLSDDPSSNNYSISTYSLLGGVGGGDPGFISCPTSVTGTFNGDNWGWGGGIPSNLFDGAPQLSGSQLRDVNGELVFADKPTNLLPVFDTQTATVHVYYISLPPPSGVTLPFATFTISVGDTFLWRGVTHDVLGLYYVNGTPGDLGIWFR